MNWEPMVGMAVHFRLASRVGIVRQRVASDRYRLIWVTGSERGEMETVDLSNIEPMTELDYNMLSAALGQPATEDPALVRVRTQIKHSRNIARVTMLPEVRELIEAVCNDIEKAIEG